MATAQRVDGSRAKCWNIFLMSSRIWEELAQLE